MMQLALPSWSTAAVWKCPAAICLGLEQHDGKATNPNKTLLT